ncbi:PPOX class F420-dependent oxidoreductase [Rhizohabitans arisaemae]|uniref:PPOX class F420-dependent oxidoreductase n=1 Tax=Rhizohabitans arisaemae TaxID=2720610 RepID=UPI0024B1E434|nr:PPOX class F420-dependent oxidoreductase [Rhizohabitans arisaemae]
MSEFSDDVKALFQERAHAWVTTVRPDGSLHSTVVWVDVDGDDVIFNTAVGRAKERHLRANPRVSVSVLDPGNDYRFASVSGEGKLELENADPVIDRLAKKYLDADSYPFRKEGEQRITVRIRPEEVIFSSGG